MPSRASPDALRLGTFAVGTVVSHCRSCVSAAICCCTPFSSGPIVTWMWSTYWCRSGSASDFHAGLRSSWYDWLGTYLAIWYGPSEIVCWRSSAESGRYCRYSTGTAELNVNARMLTKSPAGLTSVNLTVDWSVACTPEISFEVMNCLNASTVGATFANASQYVSMPRMTPL